MIEKLESALDNLDSIHLDMPHRFDNLIQDDVRNSIKLAIAELKARPRFETPEKWEQRTGEKWPDDWAVYLRRGGIYEWEADSYYFAKKAAIYEGRSIVCATEAGCPPDGWRPEE